MLKSFSHVMIFSSDVARSIKWYKDILGFDVRQSFAPQYAILFHPQIQMRLDLHGPLEDGNTPAGCGTVTWFGVGNMTEAVEALKRKGVTAETPRREGQSPLFTQFKDPDGNVLGFEEEA